MSTTKLSRGLVGAGAALLTLITLGSGLACSSVPHLPEPSAGALAEAQATETPQEGDRAWRYALVIDASSSASALQIFQWRPGEGDRLPRIEAAPFPRDAASSPWELKVKPGLGAYGGRPLEAARSLDPLIDFALEVIGDDPQTLAGSSLILRATAGMRLLPDQQQEEILRAVRQSFQSLPFAATSARVISGSEEGIYGWLSVNYLLGHLEHGGPFPTVGALDLGGASTQITFLPLDYPEFAGQIISVGRNTYHLYTFSYLGLGQDEARATVASPSCFLRGYPMPDGGVGEGDLEACRNTIREAFARPCPSRPCSLFGVYQPPLYGDFLALSVYAYAAGFFDLGQRLDLQELAASGTAFCSQDWAAMVASDPGIANDPYVPTYCYTAAHILTLLTDGFGFPEHTDRIAAPLRVQGSTVGWTLGALLYELAGSGD